MEKKRKEDYIPRTVLRRNTTVYTEIYMQHADVENFSFLSFSLRFQSRVLETSYSLIAVVLTCTLWCSIRIDTHTF